MNGANCVVDLEPEAPFLEEPKVDGRRPATPYPISGMVREGYVTQQLNSMAP